MEYPLIIDGVRAGKVCLEQQGLYTLVSAQARAAGGALTRLWLHGADKTGYLGLMRREGDALFLERKFSRNEMRKMPEKIRFASNCETPVKNSAAGEAKPQEGERENAAAARQSAAERNVNDSAPEEGESGTMREKRASDREKNVQARQCARAEDKTSGLIWHRGPGGVLSARCGEYIYTALPAQLSSPVKGVDLRYIEGRQYMVFRY